MRLGLHLLCRNKNNVKNILTEENQLGYINHIEFTASKNTISFEHG